MSDLAAIQFVYTAAPGAKLADVIGEAKRIAKDHGVIVSFDFNGVQIHVTADSDSAVIHSCYDEFLSVLTEAAEIRSGKRCIGRAPWGPR